MQIDINEIAESEVATIKLDEIISAPQKMKNNKAPGAGALPIELIRHVSKRRWNSKSSEDYIHTFHL